MAAPNPSDPLSRVLADWRVSPGRDPQFRAQVSARLATAETGQAWSSYVRRNLTGVAGALVLALALGALGGREIARSRDATDRARLASAYVQGLDARAMTMR